MTLEDVQRSPDLMFVVKRAVDVEVFSPPRQDWLAGTDTYLREA